MTPRLPTGIPAESVLLAVSLFLVVAATNILTPLLPAIRDEFGVSIATVGWVVGAFGLARLMLDLPAGFLIDRLGHRRLGVAALVLLVVASVAGLVAPSLEVLVVVRIAAGLAVAMLATIILAALAGTADPASRGKVLGLFPTANNASIAVYPLVGGIVGAAIGWRATFAVTGVLALVGALILVPLLLRLELPRRAGGTTKAAPDPRVLHGRRRVVAIGATGFGVVATMIHRHGFRSTVLPLYAATALGLGAIPIATGIALMAITALFVGVPGGALGDRIGRRQVIFAGLIALAIGDLLFLAAGNLVLFLLFAALVGLGDFFPSSQTALLTDIVPPELRNRVLAGYRFAVDVGAFIGPVLLAFVMDAAGAQAAIGLTAALLLAAAFAARLGVPAGVDDPARAAEADPSPDRRPA